MSIRLAASGFLLATLLYGNDTVFLNGTVRLKNGTPPGHAVEIKLNCLGADHLIRETVTNKKGNYYLKVERDDFNHVARALPSATIEIYDQNSLSGNCSVVADLKGYSSSTFSLSTFTIPKNLRLPSLVLTPTPGKTESSGR